MLLCGTVVLCGTEVECVLVVVRTKVVLCGTMDRCTVGLHETVVLCGTVGLHGTVVLCGTVVPSSCFSFLKVTSSNPCARKCRNTTKQRTRLCKNLADKNSECKYFEKPVFY